MYRIAIVCFFLVVVASPGWSAEPESPGVATAKLGELKSRIARLREKSNQAWAGFEAVASRRIVSFVIDPSSDRPQTELLTVYRQLYFAASFTNRVSKLVCMDQATKFLCGPPFEPKWLVYPKDANPTVESLIDGTTEAEIALEPLWQGLCKLAVEKTGKEVCGKLPV